VYLVGDEFVETLALIEDTRLGVVKTIERRNVLVDFALALKCFDLDNMYCLESLRVGCFNEASIRGGARIHPGDM